MKTNIRKYASIIASIVVEFIFGSGSHHCDLGIIKKKLKNENIIIIKINYNLLGNCEAHLDKKYRLGWGNNKANMK